MRNISSAIEPHSDPHPTMPDNDGGFVPTYHPQSPEAKKVDKDSHGEPKISWFHREMSGKEVLTYLVRQSAAYRYRVTVLTACNHSTCSRGLRKCLEKEGYGWNKGRKKKGKERGGETKKKLETGASYIHNARTPVPLGY